jgi:hypothetical protein
MDRSDFLGVRPGEALLWGNVKVVPTGVSTAIDCEVRILEIEEGVDRGVSKGEVVVVAYAELSREPRTQNPAEEGE